MRKNNNIFLLHYGSGNMNLRMFYEGEPRVLKCALLACDNKFSRV